MSKAPAKGAHHEPHDAHAGGHGGGGHDDHGGGGHCPPPWIITFADMATLLMAFFVIMLMAAETDVPKFNAFASVMRQTFGQAPLDPNDADKGGTSILDLHFGPQSGEQTNEAPGATPQSGSPDAQDTGKSDGKDTPGGGGGKGSQDSTQDGVDEAAKALAKAMADAVAKGELTVESEAGKVVVRLPSGTGKEAAEQIAKAIGDAAQAASDAKAVAAGTQTAAAGQGGADTTGAAAQAQAGQSQSGQGAAGAAGPGGTQVADGTGGAGQPAAAEGDGGTGGAGTGTGVVRAKMAALKMGMILDEQMADGSVDVEQRDGAVVVTVGAGGTFISGSSDMTVEAQGILEKLQQVSKKAKRIVVTGHTDNVPLSGGQYRDNWELGAARAASLVREISKSGLLPDAELVATSKGDTEPVASNDTEEGRAKNRRIEIEIEFDEEK